MRMFADRIELYSHGAIPNTMSVDNLPFRRFSCNETITSLPARCPVPGGVGAGRSRIMEERGEGAPLIIIGSAALSAESRFTAASMIASCCRRSPRPNSTSRYDRGSVACGWDGTGCSLQMNIRVPGR
ncbi:ATP-binding protein [Thiocapsa sp.]|uniref:ATP-binding protein n=1 Tax=Thiocapsa sp. TaxID=2024551 RepID=UPI0039C911D2